MITRIGILQKSDTITDQEFQNHWKEVHGPIASKITGLQKYDQNHVVNSAQLGIEYPRSEQIVDGFSQLWFEDIESMQNAFSSDMTDILESDEKNFIGQLNLVIAKPNVLIQVSTGKPLIKRMSILKRRPDVDEQTFQYEWAEVHAEYIKKMPNVKGYIQNHIVKRDITREGMKVIPGLEIDGIVELWFEDIHKLEDAFSSEIGQKTMAHAKTFIEEISTFLVETYHIEF